MVSTVGTVVIQYWVCMVRAEIHTLVQGYGTGSHTRQTGSGGYAR